MVFSLFRRFDKSGGRKARDAASATFPADAAETFAPSTASAGPASPEVDPAAADRAAREAARLTAEKIDRIESEMISEALSAVRPPAADPASSAASAASPNGARRSLSAVELLGQASARENGLSLDDPLMAAGAADAPLGVAEQAPPAGQPASGVVAKVATVESPSPRRDAHEIDDSMAIDVIDGALPGMLEEAAILYANGQLPATAEVLKQALGDSLGDSHRALAWQMLFDLHRATGERDAFESLAIEYAALTESSPPTWNDDIASAPKGAADKPSSSPSAVTAPAILDENFVKSVEQLVRAARHLRECSLDFAELEQVTPDGARALQRLIAAFVANKHPLTLRHVGRLAQVLARDCEVGRADPDDVFWHVAMLTLRLLGQQHRFEDLSIDYCVTYEVSPPPWEPMPSNLVVEVGGDEQLVAADVAVQDPVAAMVPDGDRLELRGDLCGRSGPEFDFIRAMSERHPRITLDCRALRRIDFTAAGELLNCLMKLQTQGRAVSVRNPNYLVYALMHVMGIVELAEVRRRKI